MSFNRGYATGFYGGAVVSSEVPDIWPVSLNGRGYMLDPDKPFNLRTVALLRQQADQSGSPSEASINPEDLWRRSMESWHRGAGQSNFDRPDSDPARFRTSKGVNVWERWQLSLLPDTTMRVGSAATNLALATVGTQLYIVDGAVLKRTADITVAPTTVTGTPAGNIESIATDGFNVWTQHAGANGIYATTRAAGATAAYVTAPVSGPIGFAKGRLMAADNEKLYNIVAGGALPTVLLTHPNSDFRWVGFAEGSGHIYAAGFSGDKSVIYRISIKADGSGLDVPAIAGRLLDGEIVRSIDTYVSGLVLVGTDKGVRVGEADGDGNLTFGKLIPTTAAVRCFEPQDRFVWYGLENYDSASTGLGRLDLTQMTDNLTPAYASDLMVAGQGAVLSAVTFGGQRVLAVSGLGVYSESTALVPVGTLDSGLIRFGLSDPKIAMSLDVAHVPLAAGAHLAYLSVDGGPFALVGQHEEGGVEGRFPCGQKSGETFEVRLELDRSATATSAGPTLTRQTLLAEPAPSRSLMWAVPLLLTSRPVPGNVERFRDVQSDLDDIAACVNLKQTVAFQWGDQAAAVFVKDFEFEPSAPVDKGRAWEGPCTVLLKVPA